MTQKALKLLDGHALIYGHSCQCSSKLVRVQLRNPKFFSELAQTSLYTANPKTSVATSKGHKKRWIVIITMLKILLKVDLCSCIKVNGSLLAALAEHNALSVIKIYVGAV